MTIPSAPAAHSVDEFVFSVPDLSAAQSFYTHFGLDVRPLDGALALHTHGHPHRWGRVLAAPGDDRKRLRWLSFGIHADDLPRFAAHLAALGVPTIAPPAGADAADPTPSLWLANPDGVPIQLRVAEKCSPSAPAPREFPPASAGVGRAPGRSQLQPVRPLHLSHILLFTRDVDASLDFYTRVLGLRLSDRSGPVIAFMHSPHGSDHHLIALAKSDGPGLHHSSWAVPSLDAVGQGSDQMTAAGYERGWGVGRHVLGSNYFRYVRDPWGSYAEYSFDIDHIPAGMTWPAADYPPEDALYVWGPALPADFITNHETAAA
jgi:catechol 2,3-dioxygenase-like lactoylglutathione lyase family enzyme